MLLIFYRFLIPKKRSTFIVQNSEDRDIIVNERISTIDSIYIIPGNGIKDSFFYSKSPNIDGKIVFTMISRLLKDKGVIEFLKAANYLVSKYPEFEARLYGGTDVSNFNSLSIKDIKEYLNPNVLYMGFHPDIRDSVIDSSVIVLPSYREGFSKVLMEAQACSRPVITSDTAGCRDAIIASKTGKLVEPQNTESLIEAMESFLEDKSTILDYSKEAYLHASKCFTVQQSVELHQRIFKEIEGNI